MKDFLENLEIGEDKVKLTKEEIKSILAEHGKSITVETDKVKNELTKENNELKETINDLNEQIKNAPKSEDLESLKQKVSDYEKQESERKEAQEREESDKILTQNVLEAIGETEFVNERTKNSIINEIKAALQDKANVGKSAKDLFNSITKDSTDIIKNPNQVSNEMPTINNVTLENTKGYEGIELNPMFQSYN